MAVATKARLFIHHIGGGVIATITSTDYKHPKLICIQKDYYSKKEEMNMAEKLENNTNQSKSMRQGTKLLIIQSLKTNGQEQ